MDLAIPDVDHFLQENNSRQKFSSKTEMYRWIIHYKSKAVHVLKVEHGANRQSKSDSRGGSLVIIG